MKGILVGLNGYRDDEEWNVSLEELYNLCTACNLDITETIIQNGEPVKPTFVGKGKVQEIKKMITDEDVVVFNHELTPMQIKNLEDVLGIEVIDRTDLILHIFESRAGSKEAKLQVEIAKLNYELPRLAGMHTEIYSQQGGSGFRGAGETKLELDRRHIRHRITKAKKELAKVVKNRQTQRKRRIRQGRKVVALVGYTNAGKSSLLNYFTDKKVYEEDMLFATLETSTREVVIQGRSILMSDTVGFISELPHHLVDAFRSTLEEVKEADLILQVIDSSSKYAARQMSVTKQVLKELGANHIPMIYVYNKIDRGCIDLTVPDDPHVFVSIKEGTGMKELEDQIIHTLYQSDIRLYLHIPYEEGELYKKLIQDTKVIKEEFNDKEISLIIEAPQYYKDLYKDYL